MNKIDKLDKELEKAREKAAEWQGKNRELEKQKQEEENSQIVQAVRSLKLTPAQLMAFLNDPKNSLTASGHTDPKPEAPEKEDTALMHRAASRSRRQLPPRQKPKQSRKPRTPLPRTGREPWWTTPPTRMERSSTPSPQQTRACFIW